MYNYYLLIYIYILIGRETQFDDLYKRIELAIRLRAGSTVLVGGPIGSGKTVIMDLLREHVLKRIPTNHTNDDATTGKYIYIMIIVVYKLL